MNEEPRHRTSRAGVLFVLFAIGGSAIGVIGWHLLASRSAGLDTSGFDMSAAPDPGRFAATSTPSAPAAAGPTSLKMVKGDASMRGGPGAAPNPAKPARPEEEAALSLKKAVIKNEALVAAFVRRMEAKHPSIARYGKDWAASPELRALRDQYWRQKEPMKFVRGLAQSNDFRKLVKQYAADPGIRDVLLTGIREAPASLLGAIGGVFQHDKAAKDLVTAVHRALGLPASLTAMLDGGKPPDPNQVISDIMNSNGVKKQPAPIPLDSKAGDKTPDAAPNGFTPLGGR